MKPSQVNEIETAMKYKMPWGRYRGKEMDKINSSYLRWLAEKCDNPVISHHADVLWSWREEMDDHF